MFQLKLSILMKQKMKILLRMFIIADICIGFKWVFENEEKQQWHEIVLGCCMSAMYVVFSTICIKSYMKFYTVAKITNEYVGKY